MTTQDKRERLAEIKGNFKLYVQKISFQEIAWLISELEAAHEALGWYANWDWTDKYVQTVPKRARDYLKGFVTDTK